jgi:hypothetical protein
MRKSALIVLVFMGAMQFVCAQNKEEKDIIVKQIQKNDRKLETFFEKGMTDSIAGIFSPNCHMASEYGVMLESRDKVKDFYFSEKKAGKKIIDYTLAALEHKIYDDIVLEVGTNTVKYSIGTDKRLYTTEYNYMLVWKRAKDGSYQIRAAMWNLTKNPCS